MFASKDDSTTFLDDEAALALEEDAVGAVLEDDVLFKVLDDEGFRVGDSLRLLLGREGMGDDGSPTSMLDKRLSINLGLQAKSPKEWLDSDENSQGRCPIYARHIVDLVFRVSDVLDKVHMLTGMVRKCIGWFETRTHWLDAQDRGKRRVKGRVVAPVYNRAGDQRYRLVGRGETNG